MAADKTKKILIVDDEEFNLDILEEYIKDVGYQTILATNGSQALQQLDKNQDIDAIILDRMMPVMDGMQFLKEAKEDKRYKNIPVIMQTAASTTDQIMEGVAAGVFYYLTKPYDKVTILTILNSALEQQIVHRKSDNELGSFKDSIQLLVSGIFHFRTLEEAKEISYIISGIMPDPEKALFGLNELTINAIEHGNLGITFEEKGKLLTKNSWHDEIKKRLKLPENAGKYASLAIDTKGENFKITIKDTGKGFDHAKYIKFDPARLTDPNGRGIAMSKMYSFDELEYKNGGSEVTCIIKKETIN